MILAEMFVFGGYVFDFSGVLIASLSKKCFPVGQVSTDGALPRGGSAVVGPEAFSGSRR